MPDLYKLIDAICETYDMAWIAEEPNSFPPFAPRDGMTFCNRAVQRVCADLGYTGFSPAMCANEMIDFMASSSDWMLIDMSVAQRMANTGSLVIACEKRDPHGHVVVVRPGRETSSEKWKDQKVPKVMNIGSQRMIGRGVNFVFPGGNVPRFYVLKEA